MVLGYALAREASIYIPSAVLQRRLETALCMLLTCPRWNVSQIVVVTSGGSIEHGKPTEAKVMADWLHRQLGFMILMYKYYIMSVSPPNVYTNSMFSL